MAFWNAPLDNPNHAAHACETALKMKRHLVRWNQDFQTQAQAAGKSFDPVHIGIGINTGDCCVGNIGSEQRFDYSVLGDEVNLASRLEGQTKVFGVDIVIGEKTFQPLKERFAMLEIDLVRVKGKTRPSKIFGLLGDQALKSEDSFRKLEEAHHQMLETYRSQNWTETERRIEDCLRLDTPETRLRRLYQVYSERVRTFKSSPPPQDWQGAVDAAVK
jgi:adenylate cyclase